MSEDVYRAADLEIRPDEHLALARGRALTLSVRELEVLAALASRSGRIATREQLYEEVWGGRLRSDDRSVDVYIHKLRAKLAEALPEWRFIHTHFGFGYRFSPEPVFTSFSPGEHNAVTRSAGSL
jgi:DNA-binding response OmpR family regulator